MTNMMKAAILTRFGGVDAFELSEVPVPAVGPRQVRVRVHATSVNPLAVSYTHLTLPTICSV
mgnify:CR=1 FL=1